MKKKNITQAYLIENGYFTKTTISRICRNSNDKGTSYCPTVKSIFTLGVALKLNVQEIKELMKLAYPELETYIYIIEKGLSLEKGNELLYDEGLPLLGTAEE